MVDFLCLARMTRFFSATNPSIYLSIFQSDSHQTLEKSNPIFFGCAEIFGPHPTSSTTPKVGHPHTGHNNITEIDTLIRRPGFHKVVITSFGFVLMQPS